MKFCQFSPTDSECLRFRVPLVNFCSKSSKLIPYFLFLERYSYIAFDEVISTHLP